MKPVRDDAYLRGIAAGFPNGDSRRIELYAIANRIQGTADQLHQSNLKVLHAALSLITSDRCDGESLYAHGVNAACERHAVGIRHLIAGLEARK